MSSESVSSMKGTSENFLPVMSVEVFASITSMTLMHQDEYDLKNVGLKTGTLILVMNYR